MSAMEHSESAQMFLVDWGDERNHRFGEGTPAPVNGGRYAIIFATCIGELYSVCSSIGDTSEIKVKHINNDEYPDQYLYIELIDPKKAYLNHFNEHLYYDDDEYDEEDEEECRDVFEEKRGWFTLSELFADNVDIHSSFDGYDSFNKGDVLAEQLELDIFDAAKL